MRLVGCTYHDIVLWYDAEDPTGVHLEFHSDGAGGYDLMLFPTDMDWLGQPYGSQPNFVRVHARNEAEAREKACDLLGLPEEDQ